jgi:ABC-2 type transport system permease protein/bacitracin transport system permease protein
MFTFIEMEFLKLKRSKIFLLSLLGAVLPPLLMFIAVELAEIVDALRGEKKEVENALD